MPTPFESAQLILSLYETRREETMRKARDFFFTFDPRTIEEFMAGFGGPQGAYVRMVISYWDMAASFVENGAIDRQMFLDANGEFIGVFAKVEPYLPHLREMFQSPGYGASLEKLTLSIPNARARIEHTLNVYRAMLAQRAAATQA
ncbi:MAG: hypothetical protein KGN84_15465 [Acidobacteriota bacterium]|nr:hypothetical protein [Acidobacteriota bacterium]